ncbi:hypothetical protein A3D03_04100 [Candidatus Gottesmanbacteria bacterium RIFCSPHIGHO2_02_FULL_40_13]|uniref:Chorismate mutase domain-containing protein n=1 Tax=Candidatus Gottesmanbacteria bacterium RIFCSPHIGHO2_02_FULL_40_13 TaxID=1798384 RepID=A0A1F6A8E1_9BACT|nr:MAG: hypothetical protein A3D03_04100 [Candidatus Gottesmanbacteria bacterium RIFCSPHIGHO2_02_FULL_40_13]
MNLEEIRREIDKIDKDIIQLIKKRLDLAVLAGNNKINNNLRLIDLKREKEILIKVKDRCKLLNLNNGIILKIFKLIILISRDKQELI